ncbi:unnamed protein product [Triticum turgidum subsp. durum]|uniref:Protein kinase domain-containing protein n=1 Tax=Triticum turgidum subsp. durum TaxID=4567 RepID=A0A9R1QPI7_TRITD|nr:unnamed protein product [Triticum turgidum subsp. durum]
MAAFAPALLLLLLAAAAATATTTTALTDDVLALVVFKTGVADPLGRLARWTEDDDRPCSWPGVGCDARAGRVTSLSLPAASLSGRLPRALLRLDALLSLSLPRNNLSGPVLPGLLASLPRLRSLDLASNRLAATVPADLFAQCRDIRTISLAHNELSGYIPPAVASCSSLLSLNLSSNRLAGPIPDGIWSLPSLRSLDLSGNSLSGSVPGGFPRSSSLRALDLSRNLFAGEIPADVGEAALLKSLDLGRNFFTGGLPDSLRRLTALRFLGAGSNALAGEVPAWIGEMWSLERLDLSGNRFAGVIPDDIAKCKNLLEADLSRNALTGELPWWVFGLPLQRVSVAGNKLDGWVKVPGDAALALHVLDLSSNAFSGGIPPQITAFAGLQFLNLSSNSISGQLPAGIGGMRLLEVLDVSANTLTGSVPPEIGGAVALRVLRMGDNSLTGRIPAQIGSCSSLVALDLSHNDITGPIPSTLGNLTSLQAVDLSQNKLNGTLPVELSNLPSLHIFDVSHPKPAIALSDDYLSQSPENDASSGKLVMFGKGSPEFSTGGHALLNKDCELGRGGFGAVYKTVLRDGQPVAIKKLTVSSLVKSKDDFERQVKVLSKMRHHNIVTLRGFYWTSSLQLLIYDYLPGGNLHKHLHECTEENTLSWMERFDIIIGVARGLMHLHQHGVVHYNLKSSNVLLDSNGEPRVGDYGLASLLPMLDRYVLSSKIQSALGYMAPEFACKTVKITEKCDVYGFGVLALEILTGRRPVEYLEDDVVVLCDLVRSALEEGRLEDCMDPRLCGEFAMEEAIPIIKLGLVCTSQVPSNRPDMGEVLSILDVVRSPQDSPGDEMV